MPVVIDSMTTLRRITSGIRFVERIKSSAIDLDNSVSPMGPVICHVKVTSGTASGGLYPGILTWRNTEDLGADWIEDSTVVQVVGLNDETLVNGTRYEGISVGILTFGTFEGYGLIVVTSPASSSVRQPIFAHLTAVSGGLWKYQPLTLNSSGVWVNDGSATTTFKAKAVDINGSVSPNPTVGDRVLVMDSKQSGYQEFLVEPIATELVPGQLSTTNQTIGTSGTGKTFLQSTHQTLTSGVQILAVDDGTGSNAKSQYSYLSLGTFGQDVGSGVWTFTVGLFIQVERLTSTVYGITPIDTSTKFTFDFIGNNSGNCKLRILPTNAFGGTTGIGVFTSGWAAVAFGCAQDNAFGAPIHWGVGTYDSPVGLGFGATVEGGIITDEGSGSYVENTWAASFSNLTVVGTAPTITGRYTQIGNVVKFRVKIVSNGGGTTASTAGLTACSLPIAVAQDDTCVAASVTTKLGLGTGVVHAGDGEAKPPTWAATTDTIVVSGQYEV